MDEEESFEMEYDKKICTLSDSEDPVDSDLLEHLVKNSRHICSLCGCSAANAVNLCSPEEP
jgi:hypothetical protein